jgi:hypothetical protein
MIARQEIQVNEKGIRTKLVQIIVTVPKLVKKENGARGEVGTEQN